MQNSSFIQNFSGTIYASGRAVVGVQYTSPHNEAAQFECADAGLKSAEDSIQSLSKLKSQKKKQTTARVEKVLTGLEQVMNVLGRAADYDPRAKTAVNLFMSVLKLELERRVNDEAIVTVCYHMSHQTSTMNAIRPLGSASPENDQMRESLGQYWESIAFTVIDFGAFAELYYNKCKWIVRYHRGNDFKKMLKDFVDTFDRYKESIRTVLAKQGLLATDITEMKEASRNIINRLDVPSSNEERRAKGYLKEHQDADVLHSTKDLQKLGRLLNDPITSTTVDAATRPLKDLLNQNQARFQFLLRGAGQRTIEYINRSTEQILAKLDTGPHDLVDEADVKEIWKQSRWKFSTECRAFVDGLCNHYTTKFSKLRRDEPDALDLANNWTIKVLQEVTYYQAIGEAIDDDASGFISVHEINRFLNMNLNRVPTPVWIAFWAVGTRYLDYIYATCIRDTILGLRQRCCALRKPNSILNDCLRAYVDSLDLVDYIIEGTDDDGLEELDQSTASRLMAVADKLASEKEELITQNLEALQYQVEMQSLLTIVGGPVKFRIEHHIMVLLHLILRKQHETLEQWQVKQGVAESDDGWQLASDVQEMDAALFELILAFHERFKSLQRSWRSQKLDIDLQIQSFSGGLFCGWYVRSQERNSKIVSVVEGSDAGQYISEEYDEELDASVAKSPMPVDADAKIEQINKRLEEIESMLKQMKHILSSTQNGHRPAAAPGVTSRTAGQEKRQQHASRGTTDLVAQRGMGRSSRPGPENHADNSYPGRRRSPDEKPKSSSNTKPPRSPSPGPDDDSYPDNTYSGRGSPDGEPQNSSDKEPQNFSDTGSARSPSPGSEDENHTDDPYPGRRSSDEEPQNSSEDEPQNSSHEEPQNLSDTGSARSSSPGPENENHTDDSYPGRGSPDEEPRNSSDEELENFSDEEPQNPSDEEPQDFSDTGSARSSSPRSDY